MEPKTTGKRIVSKGEYAANVGKKIAWSSGGVGLYLLGLLGVVTIAILCLSADPRSWKFYPGPTVLGIGLVLVSLCTSYVGRRTLKKSVKLDVGVPLTRANTADLPAPESLVRASAEPTQARETLLLRAAAQGQETPPEQLVRAVEGGA